MLVEGTIGEPNSVESAAGTVAHGVYHLGRPPLKPYICMIPSLSSHAGNILVITFTRKACKEIQNRLKDETTGHTPPVQVNTFHSWAIRFLQSRDIRDLTQRKKVTVWDGKEQKNQMGDACMRAQADFGLLPMVRNCLGLSAVEGQSPVEAWAAVLKHAFEHDDLKARLPDAKARATERVAAIIKDLSVPENAEEEEDQTAAPKEGMAEQAKLAAHHDKMHAAPGAAQLPAARIKHVAAKKKHASIEVVDSEDEDAVPGQDHLLDPRKAEGAHFVDVFFSEEEENNVPTWTLVAKELLQTYLCQEVGIEVLMALGAGADDKHADQNARQGLFQKQYMYHEMKDGASKLDKSLLKKAVSTSIL